jgi:nucleoside-diphosphate-sugar epimerase
MFRYFEGKAMVEDYVVEKYGKDGTILRPGLVYGRRKVGSLIEL